MHNLFKKKPLFVAWFSEILRFRFYDSRDQGTGPRNKRNGDLESGNIKLKVVASEQTVRLMLTNARRTTFRTAQLDVEVLRDERY